MDYSEVTFTGPHDIPQPDVGLLNLLARMLHHDQLTPERVAAAANFDVDRLAFLAHILQYRLAVSAKDLEATENDGPSDEDTEIAMRVFRDLRIAYALDQAAIIAMDRRSGI